MIRFSPLARADLRGIAKRIKTDNGARVADRVIGRILAAIQQLERFPELGRPGREPGTRELGTGGLPYVVVYQRRPGIVAVLRVIHGAMNWPPTA